MRPKNLQILIPHSSWGIRMTNTVRLLNDYSGALNMEDKIQLLQFIVCRDYRQEKQDYYTAEGVHSNLYVPSFPYHFSQIYAVTCWRKDKKFHKEVIEYATEYGTSTKSPHMDIEPVTDSVLFRWHKHQFPSDFSIERPTLLTIRVILDWEVRLESYIMIEKNP